MLYAILADIHGNLHALDAVLSDATSQGVEGVLCLGDVVGYGAYPEECIDRVRETGATVVGGNHDWGVIGKVDIDYFNAEARASILWTRERLSDDYREFLESLQLVETLGEITLVHSGLFAPEYFEYIYTFYDVHLNFSHQNTKVCFIGHSHWPNVFLDTLPNDCFLDSEFTVPADSRALVNVGSVGQPRDNNWRAAYCLYDSDRHHARIRRIEYDVQSASDAIIDAGLPPTNSTRLHLGR